MKNIKIITFALPILLLLGIAHQAEAALYYPNAEFSRYYLAPHEPLTIRGHNFGPNETVTINSPVIDTPTRQIRVATNLSGAFSVTLPLNNNYLLSGQSVPVSIQSPQSAYRIDRHIKLATYYPVITPSSYYLPHGQNMSVSAYGFAPNEPVKLVINGVATSKQSAANNGVIQFRFTSPTTGNNFNLKLEGEWSKTSDQRTVYLGRW